MGATVSANRPRRNGREVDVAAADGGPRTEGGDGRGGERRSEGEVWGGEGRGDADAWARRAEGSGAACRWVERVGQRAWWGGAKG